MKNVTKGIVWSDPSEEPCQMESPSNLEHEKIASDLAYKIADVLSGDNYNNTVIITPLIKALINDQIRQYLREYDNVVAEDILGTLKSIIGDYKVKWQSKVNTDFARHAKLSDFGREVNGYLKTGKQQPEEPENNEKTGDSLT